MSTVCRYIENNWQRKMNGEQLLKLAQSYREHKDFIANEEAAKMSLVVPFIRLLGYDPNMPREVRPEYTAEFTQGDGKRLPDRMDFAIFDRTGIKPLMVIETKPIGTNLRAKSQQLARYISQLPDLHFGIITDGCTYYFYGDLESANVMDKEPFFRFALDDPKVDWDSVAKFLSKFSRDAFNAEGLLTDAENSRYRQSMTDKLVRTLRAPSEDDSFMKWLTGDIYPGKRTEAVRARLGHLAVDAVEPALLRVMGDELIDKLKERVRSIQETGTGPTETLPEADADPPKVREPVSADIEMATSPPSKQEPQTTEDELAFFELVKDIVERAGYPPEKVIYRDTVHYFNVSYARPTRWFVRFFGNTRRKSLSTLLKPERCRELVPDCGAEDAPGNFGVSRIYIDDLAGTTALEPIIIESLKNLLGK